MTKNSRQANNALVGKSGRGDIVKTLRNAIDVRWLLALANTLEMQYKREKEREETA